MKISTRSFSPISINRTSLIRAKEAISNILDLNFSIVEERVSMIETKDLIKALLIREDFYCLAVISKISNDIEGYFISMLDLASFDELLFLLTGRHVTIVNNFEESIIKEICNILAGTLLSDIANRLCLRIDYSIPEVAIETPSALLEFIIERLSTESSKILMVTFTLSCESHQIDMKSALLVSQDQL